MLSAVKIVKDDQMLETPANIFFYINRRLTQYMRFVLLTLAGHKCKQPSPWSSGQPRLCQHTLSLMLSKICSKMETSKHSIVESPKNTVIV